jgi:hypothetical protein
MKISFVRKISVILCCSEKVWQLKRNCSFERMDFIAYVGKIDLSYLSEIAMFSVEEK